MRTLAALLVALPLVAAAQNAPPPEAPPAAPLAQPPPPPPAYPAPPPPAYPAPPPPAYQPAQPAPPAFAPRSTWRDTWYIGFGLGSGAGRASDDTGSYKFSDGMSDASTAFVNFKVGATLTPTLLLGLDVTGLRTAGTVNTGMFGTFDTAIQVSNYDAMITWFPMERGFFLRGGAGLSNLSVEVTGLGSDSVSGVNLTVGGGYAFWIGRSFNLTINLDLSAQSYNSSKVGAPTKSSTTALWLGFDWY